MEREAQEMADNLGVRIFTADIIYHLFDNFMKHRQVTITIFSIMSLLILEGCLVYMSA